MSRPGMVPTMENGVNLPRDNELILSHTGERNDS